MPLCYSLSVENGILPLRSKKVNIFIDKSSSIIIYSSAQIAQLVEQRTENPRVTGSIPVQGIYFCFNLSFILSAYSFLPK